MDPGPVIPIHMPFKSAAQRRYLYAKFPAVAKKFAAHTPKGAKLPQHVRKTNRAVAKKSIYKN